jgi:hypothetical protein
MSGDFNQPDSYATGLRKQGDQKFCHPCGCLTACGAVQSIATIVPSVVGSTGRMLPNHVFCRGCGHAIHATAPFCPNCGAPQRGAMGAVLEPSKSRIAAALLAFTLGGLGAHKFYLGDVGLGIFYLLFCWTFIPAIVGCTFSCPTGNSPGNTGDGGGTA